MTVLLMAAQTGSVLAQQAGPTETDSVAVRAVRDDVPASLVKWLAENAAPITLAQDAYPDLPAQTASSVAAALCGRATGSYWAAFRAENKERLANGFDVDAKLGPAAYNYRWPACFYVERGAFTQVVRGSDDVAAKVYKRETGSSGKALSYSRYFSRSNIRRLDDLSPGDLLKFDFRTRATIVTPRSGDAGDFMRSLNQRATDVTGVSTPADVLTTAPPPAEVINGEIVLGATGEGTTAASATVPVDCIGRGGVAFDVTRASAAFGYGNRRHPDPVQVVVVDNGFFGATRTDGKLAFAPKFSSRFFRVFTDHDNSDAIGPTLSWEAGNRVAPLNRDNGFGPDAAPDGESGHGTHVIGLIAGGDAARNPVLFDPSGQQSWLRVTVMAFSPGRRAISNLAVPQFGTAMRQIKLLTADVVNMSVRFGSGAAAQLRDLVEKKDQTLFVVAAGNEGVDLDEPNRRVYPAMLGASNRNVIAVAAEDGSGNLTAFSNKGAGFVDIAAPGCNLSSTFDGKAAAPLSGTSQAAPVVTLAATLLSRQNLATDQIKRRLIQSGDLLTGMLVVKDGVVTITPIVATTEVPIRSRSRLNVAKAQFASIDYLRYRDTSGATIEALGRLGTRSGPPCGRASHSFQNVVAFKRLPTDGSGWCFWKDSLEPVAIVDKSDATIDFEVVAMLDATGKPKPGKLSLTELALTSVDEFVMSADAADLATNGE